MVSFFFSDETRRNPFPWFAQLRTAAPVYHDRQTGLWMLFDYESVKRAMTDHEAFGSRVIPPTGGAPDWLVFMDPPRHSKMRALVSRTFTPRAIAALEPRIREISASLLDRFPRDAAGRGSVDLVSAYALPLPVMVIAELFGIPDSERERFAEWSRLLVNLSYAITGGEAAARTAAEYFAAREAMRSFVAGQMDDRQRNPRDDLFTRLVQAEVDGERLGEADVLGFFQLLLSAATETTTNLIDNAILCLTEWPDALARLRADASLLPQAIEEIVRFRSPGQAMFRQTRTDVTLHGVTIPANTFVILMVGSANRDERAIADPDRFDITRDPNPHVGFGHGIHYCLGAALARLEARVALGDLLTQLGDLSLDTTEPWTPREGLHVHGPARLTVRYRFASEPANSPA